MSWPRVRAATSHAGQLHLFFEFWAFIQSLLVGPDRRKIMSMAYDWQIDGAGAGGGSVGEWLSIAFSNSGPGNYGLAVGACSIFRQEAERTLLPA